MQNQLPLITYYMDVTSIERTLEASDARRQLSNLQQVVSHINKRFYNEYIVALRE